MRLLLLALLAGVLLLSACTPAPQPTPQATAVLPTDAPTITTMPPPVTLPPVPSTLTPVPTSTAVPTPIPTRTPEAYPQPEEITPEPFEQEGEAAVLPRLGVSNASGGGFILCDGRQWQMSWGPNNIRSDCFEHVPMLAGRPDVFEDVRAATTARNNDHNYWLFLNECEHEGQCNATPQTAAIFYHDTILPWIEANDPDAKVIVGGVNAGACGMAWLEEFVTYYREAYRRDVPRAGWQFHIYPDIWAGANCDLPWQWHFINTLNIDNLWTAWLEDTERVKRFVLVYGRESDEIWLSELGCLAPLPACKESTPMLASRMLTWFDGPGRWVDRFSWYSDHDNNWWRWTHLYAIDPKSNAPQYTAVGEIYLNHVPLPAVPLRIYHRYFPVMFYGGVTAATPAPMVYPTATPPAGYPVPGDLHP